MTGKFRSLSRLIQSQLSGIHSDYAGIAILLPHEKRVDIYTSFGEGVDRSASFLKTLNWICAEQEGPDCWACHEVDNDCRDRFIEAVK